MKRLLSLMCVAMLTIAASAQITWNVKAGIGFVSMYGKDTKNFDSHLGAKAGVGIEVPISSDFSVMPSVEAAFKGFENSYNFANSQAVGNGKETCDLLYVQIPVLLAYRIHLADAWNIAVKAGPYFGYCVYDHYKMKDSTQDVGGSGKLDINKFDAGLDLGLDFEYHRFVFGAELEWGFVSLVDNGTAKNFAVYGTIGYKF